jgi:probable FeS assembly SUF system protein SufT
MSSLETALLNRKVKAVQIPEGVEVDLDAGQVVTITQALGFSYTIQNIENRKFRIEMRDADALGKPIPDHIKAAEGEPIGAEEAEERAWGLLKQVHDPEIPVNIVDLGLVYTVKMHKRGDGLLFCEVRMTLTAPGCGMGDFLIRDVETVLKTIPGVDTVDAKVVFDPVWNPHRDMADAAKLQLGLL